MNLPFHTGLVSYFRPTFPTFPPNISRLRPSFRAFGALTFADIQGESWIFSLKKKRFVFFRGKKTKNRMENVWNPPFCLNVVPLGNSLGWWDGSPERSEPKVDEEIDASFTFMWLQ